MRALVTGANGFIGRNLVRTLIQSGVEVYAVSRLHNGEKQKADSVNYIECAMEDIHKLCEMKLGTVDVFYHLAWGGTTGKARADYDLQLSNIRYVCDAALTAKELGCKRFISTGTISEKIVPFAIKNHKTSQNLLYAIAKVAASQMLETVCESEGIDYVWARLSNIFGGDNTNGNLIAYTLGEIKKGNKPTYGPCMQPYNFTYIDDVAEALYELGLYVGEHKSTYFISNGETRLLKEYLYEIADTFKGTIGIGERQDDGIIYDEEWFLDKSFQQDIGFKPQYSFSDAIKRIKAEMG